MKKQSLNDLYYIKRELTSIIREMRSISIGVRNDFKGVGSDRCASCIDSVINNCCKLQKTLNNLDTNAVTEQFANSHK